MDTKIINKDIDSLVFAEYNPRQLTQEQYKNLSDSITRFGLVDPIIINKNDERKNIIIGGHQRVKVAKDLNIKEVPVIEIDLEYEKERELNVRLNKNTGEWDMDSLANFFELDELIDWGFNESEIILDIPDEPIVKPKKLAEKFIVPPFSVLDARQGYWRDRKKSWIDVGIQSELGRDSNLLGLSETLLQPDPKKRNNKIQSNAYADTFKNSNQSKSDTLNGGTSVFDPVLCELSYKWFVMDEGLILDPFAGGSVRGIVAEKLGYKYTGVELRKEQVDENIKQAKSIDLEPTWIHGDAADVKTLCEGKMYDFIFSCPPYYDLEVYSSLDGELSAMKSYSEFIENYNNIISDALSLLKDNRFCCFVVGDIRDKKGFYRNFVSDTIAAFQNNGAKLYNEMILVTPVGTVGMQTSRNFPIARKVGKTHQNVLVFYKGDEKEIKNNFPKLEVNLDMENKYGQELTLEDISGEIV